MDIHELKIYMLQIICNFYFRGGERNLELGGR